MAYTYAQVEAALLQTYSVSPHAAGAFIGRIKHFQRLGIVPQSPGKGRKIEYDLRDVFRWALCFELAEFGTDPSKIKGHIQYIEPLVMDILLGPQYVDLPDTVFAFMPTSDTQWEWAIRFINEDSLLKGWRTGTINLSALRREIIKHLQPGAK